MVEEVNIWIPPDKDIMPDGRIKIIEVLIKTRGDFWTFHKNDNDPFPSEPHGHNKETGEKLDPYTGTIYSKENKPKRKLGHRQLYLVQKKLKEKGFLE